ncbi:MAG: hypothetical protein V2I76_00345, partial [Roseobacter sp.]|nr:hypothetical protein [Roseobacter sp.]
QVTTGARDAQRLATFETDLDLVTVKHPAPRMGVFAVSREPVSPPNLQPAEIALVFARPASFPAQVAPPQQMNLFGDVVPELPERKTISAPKILASFNPPEAGQLTLSAPLNSQIVLQRMTGPSPLKSLPQDKLNEVWSEPTKTVALSSRVAALSDDITFESAVTADLRSIDAPPANLMLTRLPLLNEPPHELPKIGPPPNVIPSLASELGLRGSDLERYSLVTYAPTNVSDSRIAKTTEKLEMTGFPVAEGNWVNFKVSRTHIRYYSEEDEKVALAVAELLGVKARDFSDISDAPPPGRVEVWMEGNRNPSRTARQSKQEVSPLQRKEAYKAQLEDRLLNSLRNGVHLGGASQ